VHYVRAKPVIRQCLNCLASRSSGADLQVFDALFRQADKNCQGNVSLREIVASSPQVASSYPAVDGDHVDSVCYTEFIAACLGSRYASSHDVMVGVFRSIDLDRDGLICQSDIPDSVCYRSLLKALPQGRSFGIEEWVAGINSANGLSSPSHVSKLRLSVAGARFLATKGG
jgi:hypothetical protein